MSESENSEAESPTLRALHGGQKVFGRYVLESKLGQGGMGSVWLAHDEHLDVPVAMKFVSESLALDPEAVADLKWETRRGLQLTHPGIVRILSFLQDSDHVAIAMEYVDGDTLSSLKVRQPGGCFDAEQISEWIQQLCEILTYAHLDARIVHRDLKPANIMITARGKLKVLDFGISRSLADSVTLRTLRAASGLTPAFSSPQQIMGKTPSASDDIYAIGATIYDLLTGKPPFYRGGVTGVASQVVEEVPPSMAERRVEREVKGKAPIPPLWESIVAVCLHKDPEQRFPTIRDLARKLVTEEPTRRIPSGEADKDTERSDRPSWNRGGKMPVRTVLVSILAILVVIAAAVYGGVWLKGRQRGQRPVFRAGQALNSEANNTQPDAVEPPAPSDIPVDTTPPAPPEQVTDQKRIEDFKNEVFTRIDAADDSKWSKELKSEARVQVRSLTELFRLITIRFDRGAELSEAAKKEISAAIKNDVIKDALDKRNIMLVVLGYADQAGDRQNNALISRRRAETVKSYLTQNLGLKQKINAFGIGGTNLLNMEEAGGKENRAVEIWIATRR